ncbi:MAG: TolB family protein, partial [Ktedonobacterales bacterium]
MMLAGAFTPEDFWRLRFITDMDLSVDGAWIAYVVQSSDRETNSTHSAIWLLNTRDGTERRLTSGARSDSFPRFAPNGEQLAFVSTRGADGAQIWVIALAGGEARQLTHLASGASDPAWSPDGAAFYIKSTVIDDEDGSDDADDPDRPRVYTRLQYRWDGRGDLVGRTQLFQVAIATGETTQLTAGDFDRGHPTPSPDGRWLAYIADEADDRDANMSTDVYLLDLTTRVSRRLTDGAHRVSHLSWSPASDRLACFAEPKVAAHSAYN